MLRFEYFQARVYGSLLFIQGFEIRTYVIGPSRVISWRNVNDIEYCQAMRSFLGFDFDSQRVAFENNRKARD